MKGLLVLTALVVCLVRGDDLTVENMATGTEVVEAVIDIIDEACIFSDNKQMLRRIAKVETNDGLDADTFEKNDQVVFGGIWQVDENKLRDISTRNDMFASIQTAFGIEWATVTKEDMVMPLYSGLAARMWIDTSMTLTSAEIPWAEDEQATYWVNTYTTDSTATTQQYVDAIGLLTEACEVSKADIVFVLDGSGSIGAGNFDTMKNFVEEVVDAFEISSDDVRAGVIQYSSNSQTEFHLGEYSDKQDVKDKVQAIDYLTGSTKTSAALDNVRTMFNTYGRGNGVPQISIVMTDGKSNDEAATAVAAQKVHDARVTVFAVGVTSGVVMTELQAIGSDPDCIHVSVLSSFSDIVPFTSKIQQQACKAPAELTPDEDYEGSVGTGKRLFFKLKIKRNKKGLTIKLKVRSGGTRLYVSFKARNPGRAVFKYQLKVSSADRDGGRMYIPFPDDLPLDIDETDVFAALMGEGMGQQNLFNIGMNDGNLADAAAIPTPAFLLTIMAGLLALMLAK